MFRKISNPSILSFEGKIANWLNMNSNKPSKFNPHKHAHPAAIERELTQGVRDRVKNKVKMMISLNLTKHISKKETSSGLITNKNSKLPQLDRELINDHQIRKTFISKLTTKLNSTDFPLDLSPEEEIARILKIQPAFRTSLQISKLAAELEKSKYFSETKDAVFNEGDAAAKFYLIISGSVDVLIKKEEVFLFTYRELLEYIKNNQRFIVKLNGQAYSTPADMSLMMDTNAFKNCTSLDDHFYDLLIEELKGTDISLKFRYTGLRFKLRDQTK